VLVGTVSVEKSEVLATMLRAKNIPFHVLNAKQHMKEAAIVAQAGRKGAITISTNMAGRGTDILLGGNPEAMAKDRVAEEKSKIAEQAAEAQPVEGAEGEGPYRGATEPAFDEEARLKELTAELKGICEAERKEVLAAGGLKIIGTERHESRRIDNQLRGRAGRQGDPGTSRFYLSLEDDLLRIFGLDRMVGLMERLGLEEDVPIESPMVTRSIEGAQKKVEGRNFDTRKNVLEYDDVMNQQRKTIYGLRRQILEGSYVPTLNEDEIKRGVVAEIPTASGTWTQEGLATEMRPKLTELIEAVHKRIATRDENLAAGRPDPEQRPLWRLLRAEVWRMYGALLDLEKEIEAPREQLIDFVCKGVAASLVQQRERLYDLSETLISVLVEQFCPTKGSGDDWDVDGLEEALKEQFSAEFEIEDVSSQDAIAEQAWKVVEQQIEKRELELTRPWLMYFARHFSLEEIDSQWIEHLKIMEALREGIGLQGYGQKDPKKEYKKAGYDLFRELMDRLQANVATKIFRVQIQREEAEVPTLQAKDRQLVEAGAAGKIDEGEEEAAQARQAAQARGARPIGRAAGTTRPPQAAAGAAGDDAKVETVRRDRPKVGRNDPCPCGSGKKYKKCHGRDEAEAASE
jgi:preprotein translocase subunit SecA